jgi:hypothetical protein
LDNGTLLKRFGWKVRIVLLRRNGKLLAVLSSSNQDIVTVREGDLTP